MWWMEMQSCGGGGGGSMANTRAAHSMAAPRGDGTRMDACPFPPKSSLQVCYSRTIELTPRPPTPLFSSFTNITRVSAAESRRNSRRPQVIILRLEYTIMLLLYSCAVRPVRLHICHDIYMHAHVAICTPQEAFRLPRSRPPDKCVPCRLRSRTRK